MWPRGTKAQIVIISEQDVLYTTRGRFCSDINDVYTQGAASLLGTARSLHLQCPTHLVTFLIIMLYSLLCTALLTCEKQFKSASSTSLTLPPFRSPSVRNSHVYHLSIVAPTELSRPTSDVEHDRILAAADAPIFRWDLRDFAGVVAFVLRQALPIPIRLLRS
jgi:hypothetical protein